MAQTKADSLRADSIFKSLELQGVEIVKQKALVKSDIDKITYNIEDDPDSKSNSTLEMLRKVPMVTVDGEDKIQVNGSSSFKIYVNSKPNQMMSNNPSEVLKSMPASSIKRIEVITNPGPKYDAEGVGGILNIITHSKSIEGYTATFNTNAGNQGLGGGVYATVKSGKLTVSANMDYSYYDRPTSYSGSTRKTIGNITESSSNIESEGTSKYHGDSKYGSIEASYEIDSLRLITAAFDLYGGSSTSNGESWALATSPLTGNQLYSYNTLRHSKSKYAYVDGGIDYQRTFKTEEKLFTLSYRIGSEPDASDSQTDYADLRAADGWEKFIERLKRQRDDGSENTVEHTFQVDYTTPFAKHHTIETGLKYILRNNTSEDDRYEMDVMDYEHSSHYKHRNDILAAYLGYGLKIKKLSGRLGLRYEHTLQDVEYKLGPGTDFSQHFNDLVPSASLGLKLGQTTNLRLGYNMRIYRPSIWYLNPYLDDSTPTNINQGNPNLDSEKSHNISFTFSKFTPKFNINLTTQYTFTNNSIENVVKMMRDTDIPGLKNPTGMDVLYTSYENIGRSQSFNLNAYVNWNASKNTRVYVNSRVSYTDMDNGGTLSNSGWAAFAYGGAQQTLPKDWNISLNFYAYTPSIMLQGRGSSYSNYTLSIQKSWMKKRLNLTLSASNFLKKYKTFDYQTTDTYFEAANWSKSVAQRFAVTVSYRIGELKASVRKAERSISNDDVKSGGGNSSGGEK
jgi:outer membrane receptor protein involved in Fe transport